MTALPRRTGRALAALAVVAVALLIAARGSGAADGPPPVFDIGVEAAPFQDDLAAVTVLPLPLDNGAARTSISMNSQPLVISQAAVVYAPLAETLAVGQPPEVSSAAWCFSYFPSGPGNPPESRCGGGGAVPSGAPVEAGSGYTVTSGDAGDPTTLQSFASAKAAGIGGTGAPAPLSIGAASSSVEAKPVEDRMAASGATAVRDIDVGGVLTIRSVAAFVSAALSGEPGGAAVTRDLVVDGATVAGQPVEIDEQGVHAVGQAPIPLVGEDQQIQLNEALRAAGIKVAVARADEPVISADGTELRASSGSLRIELTNLETGVLSRFDLGGVDVRMQAGRPASTAEPASGGPVATGGGTTTGSAQAAPVGERSTTLGRTAAPPPPAPAPGAGAGTPTREVSLVAFEPVGDRWDLPYAPFAVLVLAAPMLAQIRRFSITRRFRSP